tara:strand:- start:397 stop:570 length:174 start_codon:yes stop_codon:yes gene_type:complete
MGSGMSNINKDIDTMIEEIKEPKASKKYIYESPDKGKTVYRREFGSNVRELVEKTND